jgi:hypothetical protein
LLSACRHVVFLIFIADDRRHQVTAVMTAWDHGGDCPVTLKSRLLPNTY